MVEIDRRNSYLKRPEQRIPEIFLRTFYYETYKVLRMLGINLEDSFEELSIDNERLVQRMMPFIIDRSCMAPLDGLNPFPKEFTKVDERFYYDNQPLYPVPVISSAVLPFFVKTGNFVFSSVDGENIYSHNLVSHLEGDRALRRMLSYLRKKLFNCDFIRDNQKVIVRFKGDKFVIVSTKLPEDETNHLDNQIRQVIDSLKTENVNKEDIGQLASFRINEEGILVLDLVRMHQEDSEISERTVQAFKFKGDFNARQRKIIETYPEQSSLIEMIALRTTDEQEVLTGILEESLFDPRLQRVVDIYNYLLRRKSGNIRIRVFTEIDYMQNHISANQSGFLKLDLASSLKSVNSEIGFEEEAGDQFLTSLFNKIIGRLSNLPRLKEINVVRRWGDFYFIDDKENYNDIAIELLMMFRETPYAVIKKNREGSRKKFTISFVKEPPVDVDNSVYVLPLIPVIGLDEDIKLQRIESGTDFITADYMRHANEVTFSTRMKVVDREIAVLRLRAIGERLERMNPFDIEFILFKMFNPADVKRGLARLKNLLNATNEDIQIMIDLQKILNHQVGNDSSSSARVNAIMKIKTIKTYESMLLTLYLNTMFNLINKILSLQSLIVEHNGVRLMTVNDAANLQEENEKYLDRI